MTVSRTSQEPGRTSLAGSRMLAGAATLSVSAGLVHLWMPPEHFAEWWGYGAFFVAAGLAQGTFGVFLLRRPRRSLCFAGIGGNLIIVALWLVSRTVGIPFFGPHAWEIEGVGPIDLGCTLAELALIVALDRLESTLHQP